MSPPSPLRKSSSVRPHNRHSRTGSSGHRHIPRPAPPAIEYSSLVPSAYPTAFGEDEDLSSSPTACRSVAKESLQLRSAAGHILESSCASDNTWPNSRSLHSTSVTGPAPSSRVDQKVRTRSPPQPNRIIQDKVSHIRKRHKQPATPTDELSTTSTRHRVADVSLLSSRHRKPRHSFASQHQSEELTPSSEPSVYLTRFGLTPQVEASAKGSSISARDVYRRHKPVSREDFNDLRSVTSSLPSKHRKHRSRRRSDLEDSQPTTGYRRNYIQRDRENLSTSAGQPLELLMGKQRRRTAQSTKKSQPKERSPSSSSADSTSSGQGNHEAGTSNHEDQNVDSPLTSPASTRTYQRPDQKGSEHSGSELSVRECSPTSADRLPGNLNAYVVEDDEEEEESEDNVEEEEESEGSEDQDSEDEHSGASHPHATQKNHEYHNNFAVERASPAASAVVVPPPAQDHHSARMRNQERERREHLLRGPPPPPVPHAAAYSSPSVQNQMPYYNPSLYSEASSQPSYHGYTAPAPAPAPAPVPAPAWPHVQPAPAAIDYASPRQAPASPWSAGQHMALTARPPMQPPADALNPHQYQIQPRVSKETKSTLTGYELMADKLAGSANATGTVGTHQGIVPMYRKFAQLNHRVLLHLQDEISELEEELRYLDECIAHASPRDEYGRFQPASRRRDARYGNDLHFRRTEVLGKVFMKLNQYNQALSSYSNMIKDLGPAKAGDIQAYQKWMEQRTPIEGPEAQFLNRKNDLVAIPRRESRSLIIGGLPQQSQAIYLPLILVLPLMAFAIVPGLLGRLFVIAMIAAVEVKIVMTTELKDFMTAREWVMCGSCYFGIMTVLAAVVH